jgi:hypothetical protein
MANTTAISIAQQLSEFDEEPYGGLPGSSELTSLLINKIFLYKYAD